MILLRCSFSNHCPRKSWGGGAAAAVELASESLRDLRIAEVSQLDLQLEDGKIRAYLAKVKVSFKYKGGD